MAPSPANLVDAVAHLQSGVLAYVAGRIDDRTAIGHLAEVRTLVARADRALTDGDAAQAKVHLTEILALVEALTERKQAATASFEVVARSLSQMKSCLAGEASRARELQ